MKLPAQLQAIFLAFLLTMVPGCSLKLARKSLSEIAVGDDKQIVAEKWGRPDRVLSSIGRWGERELWTYNCAQFSECDSNCVYVTPCYYVYFENGEIISIYYAVNW